MDQKNKLFKGGLKEVSKKILVGGYEESELPNKERYIQEMTEKAEAEAKKTAKKIIQAAEDQATALKEEVEANLENIKQEAQKDGYNEGYREACIKAEQQVKDKFSQVLIDIETILTKIEQERKESLEDQHDRVAEIVALIAKKVIHRDLNLEHSSIIDLVKAVIHKLENKAEINIYVTPATANELEQIKTEIINDIPGIEKLKFSSDDKLDLGDVILESNKERLDFRLETQIEEIINIIQAS